MTMRGLHPEVGGNLPDAKLLQNLHPVLCCEHIVRGQAAKAFTREAVDVAHHQPRLFLGHLQLRSLRHYIADQLMVSFTGPLLEARVGMCVEEACPVFAIRSKLDRVWIRELAAVICEQKREYAAKSSCPSFS